MSTLKSISSSMAENEQQITTPVSTPTSNSMLIGSVLQETQAMAKYALSNGYEVNPKIIESLIAIDANGTGAPSDTTADKLTAIHQALAKIINPASPRTILLLEMEQRSRRILFFLGPVPLIRWLSITAVSFLLILLLVSLSPDVNDDNINKGLLNSQNHVLFLNQLFLLCCAGIGACFSALFLVNKFIASATYDPRYDSSYWSRIILGLIAGIIMVELLPSSLFDDGTMHSFGKPALAMFGGFSATVVYKIIERLVVSLETLVKGQQAPDTSQQAAVLNAQAAEQRTQINAEVAAKLVNLQKDIDTVNDKDARAKINDFVQKLLPGESNR